MAFLRRLLLCLWLFFVVTRVFSAVDAGEWPLVLLDQRLNGDALAAERKHAMTYPRGRVLQGGDAGFRPTI